MPSRAFRPASTIRRRRSAIYQNQQMPSRAFRHNRQRIFHVINHVDQNQQMPSRAFRRRDIAGLRQSWHCIRINKCPRGHLDTSAAARLRSKLRHQNQQMPSRAFRQIFLVEQIPNPVNQNQQMPSRAFRLFSPMPVLGERYAHQNQQMPSRAFRLFCFCYNKLICASESTNALAGI